jgi:hypothetical protein
MRNAESAPLFPSVDLGQEDTMRTAFLVLLLCCFASRASAQEIDLSKIDRSIRKEPIYQTKDPRYCLLVFGLEAKTRVWLVIDGDILYLDRNGNGDLTDPGERFVVRGPREPIPQAKIWQHWGMTRPKKQTYETDEEPILSCGPEIIWFNFGQIVPNEDHPNNPYSRDQKTRPISIDVATKGGFHESARLAFAERPEEAPILHFDGPRRLTLCDNDGSVSLCRTADRELELFLATPGLGARLLTVNGLIPKEVHPIAEIECPPGWLGREPVRWKVELQGRDSGTVFHGPVRVPFSAGTGTARVTLSYPGLARPVMPATVEIPIEGRNWYESFLLWCLGGLGLALGGGMTYLAYRNRARLGRLVFRKPKLEPSAP